MNDVHKSYGAVKVTQAMSLALQPGEALGIIGPNGAGKSTLFNLIAGGVAPTAARSISRAATLPASPYSNVATKALAAPIRSRIRS